MGVPLSAEEIQKGREIWRAYSDHRGQSYDAHIEALKWMYDNIEALLDTVDHQRGRIEAAMRFKEGDTSRIRTLRESLQEVKDEADRALRMIEDPDDTLRREARFGRGTRTW